MSLTTDRNDPKLKEGQKNETGQHDIYLVLSDDELAKGFIRPYRDRYIHVGIKPKYPLRDLTTEEKETHLKFGVAYTKYEEIPENDESGLCGRFWTDEQLKGGCGTVTTMGTKLSETYARNNLFYGATFCVGCNKHLPVGEFVWTADNEVVGS